MGSAASLEQCCQTLFKATDKDGNGYLDRIEVSFLVRRVHSLMLPRHRWNFQEIDYNRDGRVTLEEFVTYAKKAHASAPQPQKFLEALRAVYKQVCDAHEEADEKEYWNRRTVADFHDDFAKMMHTPR
mmetsp:Transcript_6763/g.19110  ORF Transcript_6763/g.19110 Transcript_6763/m.19110 type:complete len:128 (+) Transcript_6763:69-452(+)